MGLAFSNRPVRVNEKVCLRFVEISEMGGSIEFGFTNHDPSSLTLTAHFLTNVDWPDISDKPGSWTDTLDIHLCNKNNILYYYVNSAGDVRFGINGEEKGFFSGVDTRNPLWALVDIFWKNTEVQFVDPKDPRQVRRVTHSPVEDERLANSMRSLSVDEPLPAPRYQNPLVPLSLHRTKGQNVQFANDIGVAARVGTEYNHGYVFTALPMRPGQTIVIQILAEAAYSGRLVIGFTSCDPATLRCCDLPGYADFLLDRPEYWVVNHDASNGLGQGDELAVTLSIDGEVQVSRNESNPVTIMHVDHTIKLWAFVDIHGAIQKVRMFSSQLLQAPPQQLITGSIPPPGYFRRPTKSKARSSSRTETGSSSNQNSQNKQVQIPNGHKLRLPEQASTSHLPNHQPIHSDIGEAPGTSCTSGNPDKLPPLGFHSIHGKDVKISGDGSTARWDEVHRNGIVFSSRPVCVNEKVCLRFVNRFNGAIEFGFTNHDPSSLTHLLSNDDRPKLINKPGNWVKTLENRFYINNNILYYYVDSGGDVHFGINGEEKGFFSGVDTKKPIWALVDNSGKCEVVQFVDPKDPRQVKRVTHSPVEDERLANSMRSLSIERPPAPRFNGMVPLSLHRTKGRNVQSVNDEGVVEWSVPEFGRSYVFTAQPIRFGQNIVIEILAMTNDYCGSLAIGLTSCDPATLRPRDLPDNVDFLLDRPEYWVVEHNAANLLVQDDDLVVTLSMDGKVQVSKNGYNPVQIMQVDHTLRLWAFFDMYGTIQKVRMLSSQPLQTPPQQLITGSIPPPGYFRRPTKSKARSSSRTETGSSSNQNSQKKQVQIPNGQKLRLPEQASTSHLPNHQPIHSDIGEGNLTGTECTICCENPIDSVLYSCGHMCMCYKCAVVQWKGKGGGKCPLCRGQIKDVIRTYKP